MPRRPGQPTASDVMASPKRRIASIFFSNGDQSSRSAIAAQIASTSPGEAIPAPGLLSRYRFHLNAVRLTVDEPEFNWDADFGGDIDLLDYRAGRVTFLSNYEVILGDERREFDPVQGNYTLDLSASWRAGGGRTARGSGCGTG